MSWIVEEAPNDEVHVLPQADLKPHEYDDCFCSPVTEPVPRQDGSMGWLVTHNSADGREKHEEGG